MGPWFVRQATKLKINYIISFSVSGLPHGVIDGKLILIFKESATKIIAISYLETLKVSVFDVRVPHVKV